MSENCRGDLGFCSVECRERQMYLDETKEMEASTQRILSTFRQRGRDGGGGRCETTKLLEDFRRRRHPFSSQRERVVFSYSWANFITETPFLFHFFLPFQNLGKDPVFRHVCINTWCQIITCIYSQLNRYVELDFFFLYLFFCCLFSLSNWNIDPRFSLHMTSIKITRCGSIVKADLFLKIAMTWIKKFDS